jgi:predicted Zn-dependent protease
MMMTGTLGQIRGNLSRWTALGIVAVWVIGAGGLVSGCTTNPATGERMVSFISPKDEARIGAKQHRAMVPAMGGAIPNAEIRRYIDSIGQRLARHSEIPNSKFTFTVLDTNSVNAFALPGGYVYVTRGLLALANSEAEIAGVLSHEIGHVTARHAVQRHSQAVLGGLGTAAVGVLTGGGKLAKMAGGSAVARFRSYTRKQEFEADMLGIRYLRRAGFDPGAMARFLGSLRAHARLSERLMGRPPDGVDADNIMSTHPRTVERVRRAAAQAGFAKAKSPIVGRDAYLGKIAGMVYGDSAKQGYARGRDFVHPELDIRFRVPPKFILSNHPHQVVAHGPKGARIVFRAAPGAEKKSPYGYLVNVWGKNIRLFDRQSVTINGMKAATGIARGRSRQGIHDIRLFAIRRAERMYRFIFISAAGGGDMRKAYRQTTSSFRSATKAEAASLRLWRVKIVTVRFGDTVAKMVRRTPIAKFREEQFRVLNGLADGAKLVPGQKVKLVVPERRRDRRKGPRRAS